MAETAVWAEVRIWHLLVGAVAETEDGQVTFEYDPGFRRHVLELSPLMLPLSTEGPITFPELHRLEAFQGLPGVLADALPDRFGNAVIKKYFSDRGRPDDAMRPVQKLLYIGERAMGALEFHPPTKIRRVAERESLEIAELVEQARVVIEGRPEVGIPEMMRVGASAGGARAKALILWNRAAEEVRSGFALPREGDEHWMIKFDGVGELGEPDSTPKPFNRIEFVYSRLARDAGITMPETRLLEEHGRGHLLVKRFDRSETERLHLHSLGGLHHIDYNSPGLFSYEQFLRTILALGLDYRAMEQAYRRAVFNIVAVNQDDHVKNISFLMDRRGTWQFSPAYDLTFARGTGYTRHHQMTLNGKRDDFTREDLLELGGAFGIKRDGKDVIDEVVEAMSGWEEYAREARVPAASIRSIGEQFRLL
ncbi:MAG: type II toxin-antitoxin system HipA family toxin [Gemmatimonadales bacterium]